MFGNCTETVSILHAIIFGADGACIMLSMGSILWALGAFFVAVVIAQFIARKLWAKVTQPASAPEYSLDLDVDVADPVKDSPYSDDPNYRDSAIRSTRR